MKKLTAAERINANSCVRQELIDSLEKRAIAAHVSMATQFAREVANSSGFNVYAKCTKVVGTQAHYQFKDGSTDKYYYRAPKD